MFVDKDNLDFKPEPKPLKYNLQEELEREELLGEAQDSDSDNSNSTILRLISLDEEIEHIEKALAKIMRSADNGH